MPARRERNPKGILDDDEYHLMENLAKRDDEDARRLAAILKAAGSENTEAAFHLAGLYQIGGLGLKQDREKAVLWYKRAAERGHELSKKELDKIQSTTAKASEITSKKSINFNSSSYGEIRRRISYAKMKEAEKKIALNDRALKVDPNQASAWCSKGSALADLEKYEEAIFVSKQAIYLNPIYYQAWYDIGRALEGLGKHEEAIAAYDRYLEENPDYYLAWYRKGIALENLGKRDEAIAVFDRALKIDPNLSRTWFGKGRLLAKLGKHEEAIAEFDRAITIQPEFAEFWCAKGLSLVCLSRYKDAFDAFDRASKIDPNNEIVKTMREYTAPLTHGTTIK